MEIPICKVESDHQEEITGGLKRIATKSLVSVSSDGNLYQPTVKRECIDFMDMNEQLGGQSTANGSISGSDSESAAHSCNGLQKDYGDDGLGDQGSGSQGGRRDPTPEYRKDEKYWERRRKNNEAAKRSREKRRINDMAMESKIMELNTANQLLKIELQELKSRFGILAEEAHSTLADEVQPVPDQPNPPPYQRQSSSTAAITTNRPLPQIALKQSVLVLDMPATTPLEPTSVDQIPVAPGTAAAAEAAANALKAQFLAFSRMASMMPGVLNDVVSNAQMWPSLATLAVSAVSESLSTSTSAADDEEVALDLSAKPSRSATSSAVGLTDVLNKNAISKDDSDSCAFDTEPSTSFCAAPDTLLDSDNSKSEFYHSSAGLNFSMKDDPENSSAEDGSSNSGVEAGCPRRYKERRRRNNEAVRRCRENKRQRYQMRAEMSTILEVENRKLRSELENLNSEVKELKNMLVQRKPASGCGDSSSS